MKKGMICLLLFCLLISTLLVTCPSPGGDDNDNAVTITGSVKSIETGEGIASALVTIGSHSTRTNSSGVFSLQVDDPGNETSIIITRTGFVAYHKPMSNYSGNAVIEAFMKPVDMEVVIEPGNTDGNIITTTDGASVELPQLTGFTENLSVSLTYFDVSTDEINAVPGDFTAVNTDNNNVNLVSCGIIDVTVVGEDTDTEYDLDGDGPFTVVIPVSGDDPESAPDTIELWFFDTEDCIWREQGTASKSGDVYVGSVTHFSTWNADYEKINNTCISGTIDDPDEDDSYRITLSFPGFLRNFYQTDKTFEIINLPTSTDMIIEVRKMSTGETWIKSFTTSSESSQDCLNLGTFPGEDILPEVRNLDIMLDDDDILLTWTDPDDEDLIGVNISYDSENGPSGSFTVDPGIMEAEIPDLPYGYCTVTITALYTGDRGSFGITKVIKVSDVYSFSLEIYLDDPVYVIINNNTTGFYYTEPLMLPPFTTLELSTEADCWVCWWWDGGSECDNPVTIEIDDDIEMEVGCGENDKKRKPDRGLLPPVYSIHRI